MRARLIALPVARPAVRERPLPACIYQRFGVDAEHHGQHGTGRYRRHSGPGPRLLDRLHRRSQEHDHDQAQVVPGSDRGVDRSDQGQDAKQHGMFGELRLGRDRQRPEEKQELAGETRGEGNADQAEQEHGHENCHGGMTDGEAGQVVHGLDRSFRRAQSRRGWRRRRPSWRRRPRGRKAPPRRRRRLDCRRGGSGITQVGATARPISI